MGARHAFTLNTSSWPARQPICPTHYVIGSLAIGLHVLTLTTPHTPYWILLRRAVLFPGVALAYLWVIWVPIWPVREDQWGVIALLIVFVARVIDHACFVPETHVFRLRPSSPAKNDPTIDDGDNPTLWREPVPPPFTLAKALWALSLFSSWRGIGWNFTVPLSIAARSHPYKRTSSRRDFILARTALLPVLYLVNDSSRTFMKYRAHHFFSGQTAYDDLTLGQTIAYSLAVVARVWWILQSAAIPLSIGCVLVGGYLGWETEFWAPWGWPPTFGSIAELWRYPGLSTLWSRTWNNGNRRWSFMLGWVGIGERILRLPVSGHSSDSQRSQTTKSKQFAAARTPAASASGTPNPSRGVSPSHPVSPAPTAQRMTLKIAFANLLKSFIVFTLCGLTHDIPAWTFATHGDSTQHITLSYQSLIYTTPFFAIQPLALALEALIKRQYRRAKVNAGLAKGTEPPALVFVERLVGFVIVWYWIGWTSGWYVAGVARMRLYMWEEGEAAMWSPVGGLVMGRWWH